MGELDGRVAIVTGGGRGLGREHALLLASEGAKVVVNDLGAQSDGLGGDASVAALVAEEIRDFGGEAIANTDSVADWEGAQRLVRSAIDGFGDLHILVNNAGIIRDRMLVNMAEDEWDAVINVHLKGTFCPTRHAAAYWRAQSKSQGPVKASVINTSSESGLLNNVGQTNYGAAKAGIASFTMIAAKELRRYGVRVNAIAPTARTRLVDQTPGFDEIFVSPEDGNTFDPWDPKNISPLVAYLATEDCPLNGAVLDVHSNKVGLFSGWDIVATIESERRWTIEELRSEAKGLLHVEPSKDGNLLSEPLSIEQTLEQFRSL